MPPKKTVEEEKPYLGRPGNNVKMGIVGMPNVGKSTIFNLMSNLQVPAENYPFCTIDPNLARVEVPDERYTHLCKLFQAKSEIAAALTVTDIAGLVKGAHEGKGLGNAFLSHIFAVDGIYHMVRAFADPEIEHVEGSVDPVRDMDIIFNELRLKDLDRVNTALAPLMKGSGRQHDKVKQLEFAMLEHIREHLEAGKPIRGGEWNPKEVELLNTMQLLTAKPVVFLVNISIENFRTKKNKFIPAIKKWVDDNMPGSPVIPFSASWEAANAARTEEERKAENEEHKVQSMIPRIITSGYHALDLIHFFTCGKDEVRAWTVRKGSKAPQAAGVIHSDFEHGFICADTMAYADFKELGSEAEVRKAGKFRMEGKNYTVQDGDIFHFKFNN